MIHVLKPHAPKIVTRGMSCSGKTTFANMVKLSEGYTVYHFDPQFTYELRTLAEVSRSANWKRIIRACGQPPWIMDNWTTEDTHGDVLFSECPDACVYVIFDTHQNILDRYRVPVVGPDAFYSMYEKMYRKMEFEQYPSVRYFMAIKRMFREVTRDEFRSFIAQSGNKDDARIFDPITWRWQ